MSLFRATTLIRGALCALLIAAAAHRALAGEIATGFVDRVLEDETGVHKYKVFVPKGYTPEKQWPVILYLHSASARGRNIDVAAVEGIAPHIRVRQETFPFLVVIPQCENRDLSAEEGWLADSPDGKRAIKALDAVEREFSVDRKRELMTGMSMGAFGVWSIATKYPDRWAGIMVLAGVGDPAAAPRLKHLPICAFHGTADKSVPIEDQRRMIAALRAAGGDPLLVELKGARHLIAHIVYSDDDVYAWMLDPRSKPKFAKAHENPTRVATAAELGFDAHSTFVPGAEIPKAVYVRLSPTALDAMAYSLPETVPADLLSKSMDDIRKSTRSMSMTFDLTMAGMSSTARVEQAQFEPRNDGRLRFRLGLRDLHMHISQTTLDGLFVDATAGPIHVVIGQQRPVWLDMNLRPYVEGRRLRFEIVEADFQIPDDNWYVTSPNVSTRTIPGIRRRLSEKISGNLVSGLYGRKGEIEQQMIASVPSIVAKLEERFNEGFTAPQTIPAWPMPSEQPRFNLWPSAVHIDASGMILIAGMSISRPGLNPPTHPPAIIERNPLTFEQIPKLSDIQVGLSGDILDGCTAVMIESGLFSADIRDLSPSAFRHMSQRDVLQRAIPDLARYGEDLKVRTRVELKERATRRSAEENNQLTSSGLYRYAQIDLPRIQLSVQISTVEDAGKWRPCATFDMNFRQIVSATLDRPSHEGRKTTIGYAGKPRIKTRGQFAEEYRPQDDRLDTDLMAELFTQGWEYAGPFDLMRDVAIPDVMFGSVHMRMNRFGFHDQFTVRGFGLARTKIANGTAATIEYQVRGPATPWSGPLVLKPGDSHEFPYPYPLTMRRNINGVDVEQSVLAGSLAQFKPAAAAPTSITQQ